MRRLSATLFCSILICTSVTLLGQEKSPFKLGLNVSPNIGWMNPSTDDYNTDGASLGGTIGFMGDFYFARNYAFTTGFNFQYINGKLNYSDSVWVESVREKINGDVDRKYRFIYLEIPVMIKMKTNPFGDFSFYGQIGLGTGFRIKATAREHFMPDTGASAVDKNYNFDGGTTLIRESILIGGGMEYAIDESSRLVVGIGYSNALNNVLSGENHKTGKAEKSSLNYFELTVGILF